MPDETGEQLQMNVGEALDKAVKGTRLSDQEALALFHSGDLPSLGAAAHRRRLALHPAPEITYCIDRNINYTNVCVSGCEFCAYYRNPSENNSSSFVITHAEIAQKIEELQAIGGNLILLQGGLHPDLKLDFFTDLLQFVKTNFGIHLHCFSPPEIIHFSRINDISITSVIMELRDSGLDSIPGGGAEILCDSVRQRISPNKCTSQQWLEVMRTAHNLGVRTTATMMFGHIETLEQRIEHLRKIRQLQDETHGFTAFIPWTFQPSNTRINVHPVGGYDYLRTLAISRLYLDNIANLQASWVTQGAKVGQMALLFGANDIGGTMMEENVVRAAGTSFTLSPQNILNLVTDAGFSPIQRNFYYQKGQGDKGAKGQRAGKIYS